MHPGSLVTGIAPPSHSQSEPPILLLTKVLKWAALHVPLELPSVIWRNWISYRVVATHQRRRWTALRTWQHLPQTGSVYDCCMECKMLCCSVAKFLPEHPVYGPSYRCHCHKTDQGSQKDSGCVSAGGQAGLQSGPYQLCLQQLKIQEMFCNGHRWFSIHNSQNNGKLFLMTDIRSAIHNNRVILCSVYSSHNLFQYLVSN